MTKNGSVERQHELAALERALGLGKTSRAGDAGIPEANIAVSYLRVSSIRQTTTALDIDRDGNSIDTQRTATREFARALGVTIVKEFVEPGQSAQSIENRPAFQEMLEYLRDNRQVRQVIIYARSRAFRNRIDAAITTRMLKVLGVKLTSVNENFGEGYDAEAMEGITDIFNELQVRKSGEDIRNKMLNKVQRGGSVGRAPIGYLNIRKDVDGYLVNSIGIDPVRAPLIRWAFGAYATGEYSIARLRSELEEQGLTTRPSRRWAEKMLSKNQVANLLRDPYYTGYIRYKGDLYPGNHEPLVSFETFRRVQDVLEFRARRTQRDRIHAHYLRGLLTCQQCHDRGFRRQLIFTRARGNGGEYDYFICNGRLDIGCTAGAFPVRDVEAAVYTAVKKIVLKPSEIDELRRQFQQLVDDEQSTQRAQRSSYQKQLRKLAVQEENLLNLAADGTYDSEKLREKLRGVSLEQAALRAKLEAVDSTIDRGVKTAVSYLGLLDQAAEHYRDAADPERRRILETHFSDLRVGREDTGGPQAGGVLRPPVAFLQDRARGYPDNHNRPRLDDEGDDGTGDNPSISTGLITWARGLHESDLVGPVGLEPTTRGLKVRCSTN